MPIWLLTFLILFASVGAVDELSWEAQQPFLKGLTSERGLLFSSMCIGSQPELVRRCLMSAARWRYVVKERDIPLVYYVKNFPQEAIDYLKTLHNVYVVVLAEMEWLPSETYPTAPLRFYSFYKLAAFNLYGYRVVWFDSDAYLFQNPTFLFDFLPKNATGDELVAWKAQGRNHDGDYFNSGLIVFKPSKEFTQRIYDTWATGDFRMHFKEKRTKAKNGRLTEQEVLLTVFPREHLIPLPNCLNFRAHHKYAKINRHCNVSQIVAFHDWQAFTEDTARRCWYWKKAMLMGSSPRLCDVDSLADGAPEFSLDDCAPYFIPPSQTHLCNASIPYSPAFLPNEEEKREHFNIRRKRRKHKAKRKAVEQSIEEEEDDAAEEEEQIIVLTYDESLDPSIHRGLKEPELQDEHPYYHLRPHQSNTQEKQKAEHSVDQSETAPHHLHHLAPRHEHHQKTEALGGGEHKGEQSGDHHPLGASSRQSGDQSEGGPPREHHYLDQFRHEHQKSESPGGGEQKGEQNGEHRLPGATSEKSGDRSESGPPHEHHYLNQFRHEHQKSESPGGGEQKGEQNGEHHLSGAKGEQTGDRSGDRSEGGLLPHEHHYLNQFCHEHQKSESPGGGEQTGEQSGKHHLSGAKGEQTGDRSEGGPPHEHHYLDQFRHEHQKSESPGGGEQKGKQNGEEHHGGHLSQNRHLPSDARRSEGGASHEHHHLAQFRREKEGSESSSGNQRSG